MNKPLLATIAGGWRTSWFPSIEAAVDYADRMLGVDSIEEIGIGIVWQALPY